MHPTNTIRILLALKFSEFYYYELNEAFQACILAKNTFDEIIMYKEYDFEDFDFIYSFVN